MSEETQQDLVECTTHMLEKYNKEKGTAAHIMQLDKKYYAPNTVLGRYFSSL
jgi:hypothetical protein